MDANPIDHTTAPTRDRSNAIMAKGNPNNNPRGLQRTMLHACFPSLLIHVFMEPLSVGWWRSFMSLPSKLRWVSPSGSRSVGGNESLQPPPNNSPPFHGRAPVSGMRDDVGTIQVFIDLTELPLLKCSRWRRIRGQLCTQIA